MRSPTWSPTSPRGPSASVAGLLALPRRRDGGGERTRARRGHGVEGPRADPHRARRQGAGVAGRRRAAPERPGVPVDGDRADLADRCRRPAAAAARRPRRRCPSTACPCSTPPTSTTERRCPTRSPRIARRSTSVGSTRSADCCTSRSPVPRTPCCCRVITGAPPRPSRAARRTSCVEIKDVIDQAAAAGDPCGVVEHWAPAPADGEPNPLRDNVIEAIVAGRPGRRRSRRRRPRRRAGRRRRWPADAVGATADGDVDGWAADVDALLAERELALATARAGRCPRSCRSARWWTSAAIPRVRCSGCSGGCRPAPTRMRCWARRFTTGCSGSSTPSGCSTSRICRARSTASWACAEAERLAELQAAFAVSPWAARTPVDVEVPFDMVHRRHGGPRPHRRGVRRRRRRGHRGGLEDRRPAGHARGVAAQRRFSSPCTGWRGRPLQGVSPSTSVRAAFHYVRSGRTVAPDALPDADELAGAARRPPSEARCGRP